MNHRQAGLANRKDMLELLKSHPINRWLKKWIGRVDKAEADRKIEGYKPQFLKGWELFGKRGNKADSAVAWDMYVIDPELVYACIPRYLEDCKKGDIPVQHFQRWLKGERWEQYDQIKKEVAQKRACELCRLRPWTEKVSYKEDGQWWVAWLCDECKQDKVE